MQGRSYPGKVLLFGEYTVLNGSKALSTPNWEFSGKWSKATTESPARTNSRQGLGAFIAKSRDPGLDLERLEKDFADGLWFDSSLPHGYGLGSSGALVAAIYEDYCVHQTTLAGHMRALASLEDFFHGASSGLDPLVSYLGKAILINRLDNVAAMDEAVALDGFFLANTGQPRQTAPLVRFYETKMKDEAFKAECAEVLNPEVNAAIDFVCAGDRRRFLTPFKAISAFQRKHFSELILPAFHGVWDEGLATGEYLLKLCGAGGGGFILGYAPDFERLKSKPEFARLDLRRL